MLVHKRVLVIALLKLDFSKKKVVNIYHVILLIVFFRLNFISRYYVTSRTHFLCVYVCWFVCVVFVVVGEMKAHLYLTCFFFLSFFFLVSSLQLQLIGNAGGNVFKGGRCARYTLEADPIQTQARQFTHLHFPLDQIIFASVTVNAEEHELLALLVVAMIITQNLDYFIHHCSGIH